MVLMVSTRGVMEVTYRWYRGSEIIKNTGDKNTTAIQISYLNVIAILRILPRRLYFDFELHPETMIM